MPGQRKGHDKQAERTDGGGTDASSSSVETTSTLTFTVDGLRCRVENIGQPEGTEYDCRSQLGLDEIDGIRGPSYTTNALVDAAGGLSWDLASAPDPRPGTYHTKLCAANGGTTPLDGPDGQPLEWRFPNPNAA